MLPQPVERWSSRGSSFHPPSFLVRVDESRPFSPAASLCPLHHLLDRAREELGGRHRREPEKRLLLGREGQRVDRLVELIAVVRVELAVLRECAEGLARVAASVDEVVDELGGWPSMNEMYPSWATG
jgi:hypothetical protein